MFYEEQNLFKIKRNGVYHARLVACGYRQIPGVNFSKLFSSSSSHHLLTFDAVDAKCKNCCCWVSFLHGDLIEEIHTECPPDLKANEDEILILDKCIIDWFRQHESVNRQ